MTYPVSLTPYRWFVYRILVYCHVEAPASPDGRVGRLSVAWQIVCYYKANNLNRYVETYGMKKQLSAIARSPRILWLLITSFLALDALAYWLLGDAIVGQKFTFAVTLTAALLHLSALGFYIRGLRHFKSDLRVAYARLGLGIGMLGIAFAQLPVINFFGLYFWLRSGGVLLPYLIAVCLIFFGLRRFASSLKLTSKVFSFWRVGIVAAVIGVAACLLPHTTTVMAEPARLGSVWLTTVIAVFFVCAARGTLLIKRAVGVSYGHGLAWLFVAFVVAAISSVHYIGDMNLTSGDGFYFRWSVSVIVFDIVGLTFMKAGFALSTIDETVSAKYYPRRLRGFFGLPAGTTAVSGSDVTSMDIIVFMMGLASNPSAIDNMTDDMRVITSRISDTGSLTSKDQAELLSIYRRLEDYLIKDEPLRHFGRREIRDIIKRRFMLDPKDQATFWPRLSA